MAIEEPRDSKFVNFIRDHNDIASCTLASYPKNYRGDYLLISCSLCPRSRSIFIRLGLI